MFDEQFNEQSAPFVESLKEHRRAAIRGFFAVILLFGLGAYLTRQFSASALLALNPHASLNAADQQESLGEVAWTALTDKQIESIISRYQLDDWMAKLRAQDRTFTYLRSNISLVEIQPPEGAPREVLVSYTGENRSKAIDVTNAIAQNLSHARAPGAQEEDPGEAAQTSSQAANPAAAAAPPAPAAPPAAQPPSSKMAVPKAAVPKPVVPAGPSNDDIAKARAAVAQLAQAAQSQGDMTPVQAQVQQHLRKGAQLEAQRQDIADKLAALQQQSQQATLAASRAQARPAPPPPNPLRQQLQQQIKEAQAHLAALRLRYTDQYPDIEEAKENIAALGARLQRIPPDQPQASAPKPAAPSLEQERLASQINEARSDESRLDDEIQDNENETEVLRQRVAKAKSVPQQYAAAQQHLDSLLKAQQVANSAAAAAASAAATTNPNANGASPSANPNASPNTSSNTGPNLPAGAAGATNNAAPPENTNANTGPNAPPAGAQGPPMFMVVQSASSTETLGIITKPLFWLLALVIAMLAAVLSVYLAEQFAPAVEERTPSRSLVP